MVEKNQIYKCNVCSNIVEIVHASFGTLVCCNQNMELKTENTVDASVEKHVPVYKREGDNIEVVVGSVIHPMEEKHYIELIEVITENKVYRKYLMPNNEPKANFCIAENEKILIVREYCNLHGLWVAK